MGKVRMILFLLAVAALGFALSIAGMAILLIRGAREVQAQVLEPEEEPYSEWPSDGRFYARGHEGFLDTPSYRIGGQGEK